MSEHFDTIVVEAGSAGALMESRLNEEPDSYDGATASGSAGQLLLDPPVDAMSAYIKLKDKPGPHVQEYESTLVYCNNHGTTIFHPAGTCKVGTDAVNPCTTGSLD